MKTPEEALDQCVAESHRVQADFFGKYRDRVLEVAETVAASLKSGKKILFFGNGGSAADAQHMAAELVGRFMPDRPAVPAISLSTDTSVLTALGNDYGYDQIFARQLEAHGNAGDTAVAISTSGNSPNVLAGIEVARERGLYTIGFTGETGGKMVGRVEVLFQVPCRTTPRIQETHILLGHVLCELIDRQMFPDAYSNA